MSGSSSVVLDAAAVAAVLGAIYAIARGAESLIRYFTKERRDAVSASAPISQETLKLIEAMRDIRSAVEMHDATEVQRLETLALALSEHRKSMADALNGLALAQQQIAQTLAMLSTLLAERKCVASGSGRRRAKVEKRRA